MAYTVGEIIDQARALLNDQDDDSYRYTDTVMYSALNKSLSEARRARADLFLSVDGTPPQFLPEDVAEPFPLGDMYVAPIVEYISGYAELRDDEYTVDGRAMALITAFTVAMTGG